MTKDEAKNLQELHEALGIMANNMDKMSAYMKACRHVLRNNLNEAGFDTPIENVGPDGHRNSDDAPTFIPASRVSRPSPFPSSEN